MSNVVVKKVKQNGFENELVYIKNAICYYASVHEPKNKWVPEGQVKGSLGKEYSITLFVDKECADELQDKVLLNKTFAKVGVDKNKKRVIKYPLTSQLPKPKDGEKEKKGYDEVDGLYGAQFSTPQLSKKGKPFSVTVIGTDGQPFEELIGNGSKVTVKLTGYRNTDGLLNTRIELVQVIDHVPFEEREFDGNIVDDELGITYTRKAVKKDDPKPSDSEDDGIPFDEDDYN